MGSKIGVAVVGIAGYARSHFQSIISCVERGLCEFNAVTVRPQDADPDAEGLLESRGVKIYRDFGEMLDSERSQCELVTIPTGIPSHRFLSAAALEAGYHVVCEKPAAGTVADAEAMRTARDNAGRILAIGYQYIYSRSVQMLKSARVDKRWGNLNSAKCLALWPRTNVYYARNEWAGEIESGGRRVYDSPSQNAVSHFLNTMLYVAGNRQESSARAVKLYGENYRAKEIASADTQFLRIHTDTDVKLEFWCSHSVRENHDIHMSFTFDQAEIEFFADDASNWCVLHPGGEPFGVDEPHEDIRRRVFTDAFEAIDNGGVPLSPIDNAICHTEVIETLFTRCAPVAQVESAYIEALSGSAGGEGPEGENRIIKGLDELAAGAFDSGLSYAEAGAEWGVKGAEVTTR